MLPELLWHPCSLPGRPLGFLHPLSTSWCQLCPLTPPPPATTAASPQEAAQMLVWGVWILSHVSIIQSRALTTKAEPRAPLPWSVFSLPLLTASISCLHLCPSRAKHNAVMLTSRFTEISAMHYSFLSSFFLFFGIQNKTVVGSIDVCQHPFKKKRRRKRKKKNQQQSHC